MSHKKITIIGSTGLIGKTFLNSILENDYEQVTAITRRTISTLTPKPFIKQSVQDFSDLDSLRGDLKSDVLICALGTTIKIAGSKDQFRKIDLELPLRIAEIAVQEGCTELVLITAVGADANSTVFYNQSKGLLENEIQNLPFKTIHLLRPSMLLGEREESRIAEIVGKLIMRSTSFLIPWKYKPIHARTISATIHRLIAEDDPGIHIYEGKDLY